MQSNHACCPSLPQNRCRPSVFRRTSHEISKVSVLDQEALRPLLNNVAEAVQHHRDNALNPAHPHQRGTSQGPDIYFQMLEAANKYYLVSSAKYLTGKAATPCGMPRACPPI